MVCACPVTKQMEACPELAIQDAQVRETWNKIWNYDFEARLGINSFPGRVAAEYNIPVEKVIEMVPEYRRALLLMAITKGKALLSPQLDLLYHVHYLHGRPWLYDFCPNVLGFELLHDECWRPDGKGGCYARPENKDILICAAEPDGRLRYDEALRLYPDVFGFLPPPHIWPLEV